MLIDINCSLGNWPFLRFKQRTAAELSQHIRDAGIDLALVSSIDSALFPEPDICNRELMDALAPFDNLRPLMTIDPTLTHWEECLDQYCADGCGTPIRLIPNYHRYSLDDERVHGFVAALSGRPRAALVIQMRLEDERRQYPLMQVPGVPVPDALALAEAFPALPIVCLCAYFPEAVKLTSGAENTVVDTSFLEYLDSLKTVLARIPEDRLLFGSHTPFLYTEANLLKLRHATIPAEATELISCGNAGRIIG